MIITLLDMIRLIVDAQLLVLIWMIQLVVYPSFVFLSKEKLILWHKKYTQGLSFIVIPLMFGQLGVSVAQLILFVSWYTVSSLVLIIGVWIVTFSLFVPIHTAIANGVSTHVMLGKLVRYNWLRTVVWTLIALLSGFQLFLFSS